MEAALAQAAEQYNSGGCDLEAFVMRMVAICGRDVVVESLHAVGYGNPVRIRRNLRGPAHRSTGRQPRAACSAGAASCQLQNPGSHSKLLMSVLWCAGRRRQS